MKMVPLNVIVDYQVTPIISITFYMVIIRVGLATRANHTTCKTFGNTTDDDVSGERRRRMQVLITTLTESKVDDGQRSLTFPASRVNNRDSPSSIGPDSVVAAV